MKILLVAMPESVHTARWVRQFSDRGWDIRIFSSTNAGRVHPQLHGITIYQPFGAGGFGKGRRGIPVGHPDVAFHLNRAWSKAFPQSASSRLAKVIRGFRPDVIHSLEIQHAGYLVNDAKKLLPSCPPWIVTNWGSDIYLFGRFPEHEAKIREVLASSDYYSCECRRDVCLAKAYGFAGEVLPVIPNTGGIDLVQAETLRAAGPASGRRLILLKGYQNWAGRSLVGLRALERCADLLDGYRVAIYSASPDVELAAKIFAANTGVGVEIIPGGTSHEEMLGFHGRARISIGLSISDAVSTSFLEAMAMGSFPIQSWTSCADEWIEDGVSGILVPPEDPEIIETALRRALTDDALIDRAEIKNRKTVAERLDYTSVSSYAASFYERFEGGIQ